MSLSPRFTLKPKLSPITIINMGYPKLNKTTNPMNPNFGIWTTPRLLSPLFGLDNENTACGDLHLYTVYISILIIKN